MVRLLRLFTVCIVLICSIVFVSTIAAWARSYRHPPSVGFRTPAGRHELACRDGRVVIDNAPQMKAEFDEATGEINRRIQATYQLVRENYENSGRDLADGEHPESRATMSELLNEIQKLSYVSEARVNLIRARWVLKPVVVHSTPCWSIVLISGLILAILVLQSTRQAMHSRLARRRIRTGNCPRCGYDLRATPGRCPECGYVVASS